MKQVKVTKRKNEDDKKVPAVQCESCDQIVSPQKNPLMDGYDCECGHVFQNEEMHAYEAAVSEAAEQDEDEEYGF
jgi:hypothetical protein